METSKNYDEIFAAGEGKINEKKTIKAVTTGSLPKSGKFVGWSIEEFEDNTGIKRHFYQLHCENGEKISLSSLQQLAHFGKKEDAKFKAVTKEDSVMKGKFVLTGVKTKNPVLSGNQAKVISEVIGKNFTTKTEEGYVVNFDRATEIEAEAQNSLDVKTFYEVTFK